MRELTARTADGLTVAAIDLGGSGDPVVLLHGATLNAATLEVLAGGLAPRHCVSIDLRGSGQSDQPKEYRRDGYLLDIEAVAAVCGLENPAVVGHSAGGIIAATYGARHPECPGVVNLDGHGFGQPRHYPGISEDEVAAFQNSLEAMSVAAVGDPGPGDAEWMKAQKAMTLQMWLTAMNTDDDPGWRAVLERFVDRRFVQRDGRWWRQPDHAFMRSFVADYARADLFDTYRAVECPLLIASCSGPIGTPPEMESIYLAMRRGLEQDLDELAGAMPNVRIARFDCGHVEVLRLPEAIATIDEFLPPQIARRADMGSES